MAEDIVVTEMSIGDSRFFPWWLLLVWGILTLLIGVMFLLSPGITTIILITFMGAYWLVGGVFTLVSLAFDKSNMVWKIFLAIINIIAGIMILCYPLYATIFALGFLVIFIGFWACFVGGAHLYHAFTEKDAGNGVLGIISLIFGIILLINPFIAAALLPFVAGGFAIVMGLCSIFVSFTAKQCVDVVKTA